MVPPDYDRPNRMGLIPGHGYTQSVPNYWTRGDMAPKTMEMNREEHGGSLDMPEWHRRPRRLAQGGKVDAKFIEKAIKKPGALRAQMGVKAGETIPKAKLAKAAKAPGKLGQRARFAQTLSKMGKK